MTPTIGEKPHLVYRIIWQVVRYSKLIISQKGQQLIVLMQLVNLTLGLAFSFDVYLLT